MLLYNAVGFAIAAIVMVRAGSYAVKYVSSIAKADRISAFLTSFLLVGIVSSFPETFVSVVSAIKNEPSLGLGTLLGGNIADLTLVIGLVGVAAGSIKIRSKEFAHEFWLVGLLMLPILFSLDGSIGRIEGLALILSCLMFIFGMLRENNVLSKLSSHSRKDVAKNIALFLLSSAVVLTAANFVVKFAEGLALDFKMPIALVGIVFIGAVTTLPELMFSLASVAKHIDGLALGDIFGTVIIDATLIVGITALISPITIVGVNIMNLAAFTALSVSTTIYFLKPGRTFTRNEALLLILLYVIFVATQLTTSLQ
ncbi:sodium:calcium antiporter [Candidatus Woesearchaeota archaeon]|nr:sodium:calcium antiporter [Candidatus Woesearchaeota archaeon]